MKPLVFLDTETTSLAPWREAWEIAMIRRDDQGQKAVSFFVSPVNLAEADPMSLKFSRFYERHPDFDGPQASHVEGCGPPRGNRNNVSDQTLADLAGNPIKMNRTDAIGLVHRWTRDAFIVGAVPNFDTDMLHRDMLREKLTPAWHYHLRDIEAMAVGYLLAKSPSYAHDKLRDDWDSDALSRECGVEPPNDEERHTALGDARWVMRMYDAITGAAKR